MNNPELFIKGSNVIIRPLLVNPDTNKAEAIPFATNGVTAVVIKIGELVITDAEVTIDFDNDEGDLIIHRNDFVIAAGDYEVEIWIIDRKHPSPGQLVSHPSKGNEQKVIFHVP